MIQGIILTIGMIVILVIMIVVFIIHSIIKLFFPEKESQKKTQQPTVIDMGTGSWVWIPKAEEKIIAVEEDETKKVSTIQKTITTTWETIKDIIGTILVAIMIVFGIPIIIVLIVEYFKKLF
jgi:uncharacterized membrane protein YraQ (UPF0718 family)